MDERLVAIQDSHTDLKKGLYKVEEKISNKFDDLQKSFVTIQIKTGIIFFFVVAVFGTVLKFWK